MTDELLAPDRHAPVSPVRIAATDAPDQPLRPMEFERRALRPNDVSIKITYAGICHSDLHTARNDWGGTRYPNIPGHEIVGTVTAIGNEVTRHRVGDTVAVGCMVDSCMECDQCLEGWEVFCRKGCVQTYNSKDYHQESDEYDPSWDFSGAVEDLQVLAELAWRIAAAPDMPAYNDGDQFANARAPRS